jgi:hypothetical protein|tara:strand:+ start:487 stop:657 length:171 start_codon:yes stop_codon:yes gene_type:complete
MSDELETFTIPMTDKFKEKDPFKVGKHSKKLKHNDTEFEWEITPEAREAIKRLHSK